MLRRAIVLCSMWLPVASAYSVLSHEATIDLAWEKSIKPLLLKQYPNTTEEELRKAHAYAYGGAIIQDLGYYPFGNKLFSDLTHYVRSGDFITNLMEEAQDVNEYAFALGSLAHYSSDNKGHPMAVNLVVPMMYPELQRKVGKVATYEDSPADHLKVEFSFDVDQVANGHYAPEAYHDFIGFEVAKPVLERAFLKTYGVPLKNLFLSLDLALGTYRHSISGIIPEMTKVAWEQKKDDLMKATPGLTERRFIYNLSKASYRKEWGNEYERPGIWARFLAFLLNLMPHVGPFKALSFKAPPPAAIQLFEASFNASLAEYVRQLNRLKTAERVDLPNTNFDTGKIDHYGDYGLADKAYADLLDRLAKDNFGAMDPRLRANILQYYGEKVPDAKTAAELAGLRAAPAATR